MTRPSLPERIALSVGVVASLSCACNREPSEQQLAADADAGIPTAIPVGSGSLAAMAPQFQAACNDGMAEGCFNLGVLHVQGDGIERDVDKAAELFSRACAKEHHKACSNLGILFEAGRGVPLDIQRAKSLYQKACAADPAAGCVNLGHMYETGKGVSKDVSTAVNYYLRGCEAGRPKGCLLGGLAIG